jgi:hypothetical protein
MTSRIFSRISLPQIDHDAYCVTIIIQIRVIISSSQGRDVTENLITLETMILMTKELGIGI